MIGQFDFSDKGWVRGAARSADWKQIEWSEKQIQPQYLMSLNTYKTETLDRHLKSIKKLNGPDAMAREEEKLSDPVTFDIFHGRNLCDERANNDCLSNSLVAEREQSANALRSWV
jgi:hypothetical protein